MGDGDRVSELNKADLERRIEESRSKIEEISRFRENAMIDEIIRAFKKQIAQDSYRLSLLNHIPQAQKLLGIR